MATLATDPSTSTQNQPSGTESIDRKLLKFRAALSRAKAGLTEIDLSDCGLNQFPLELLGSPNIKVRSVVTFLFHLQFICVYYIKLMLVLLSNSI